jgi:squalene-hopene/tetraprenyl-beta-curcumene cyclase
MLGSSARCPCLVVFVTAFLIPSTTRADEPATWNKEKAAAYLDGRAKVWFEFGGANRGQGMTQTSCVSCHTLFPYALSRPVLRSLTATKEPTEYEKKFLTHVQKRVEGWAELDTPPLRLFYDFNDRKKLESWGTEAVLNAVLLAWDDQGQARKKPSDPTKRAFDNLWKVQARTGNDKGSWDWLDFNLQPWESKDARYFGATLAAVAVGTAPGYYAPGDDKALDENVERLRGYLKGGVADQNLYNRVWALWASAKLDGVLTKEEQKKIIEELLEKQQEDGGWSLPSLGRYVRSDGTAQETASDGYATGLVLHVLQTAGLTKDNAKIAKGLTWLVSNQAATGEWRGVSVNKKRDPATHVGKFMSDAATGYAVLALSH